MENPLTGKGEFIGHFFSTLAGFLVADVADRFATTTALTVSATAPTGSTAPTQFNNTAPATGPYAGLYNPTAIAAPMWVSPTRMLVGGAVMLAFWGGAGLVKNPGWKTGLTIAGYGAGVRVLGKMAIDGIAMMTMGTQMGQQLWDGEMRANLLQQQGQGSTAAATQLNLLPSAGLGRPAAPAFANGVFPPLLPTSNKCAPCSQAQGAQGAGYPQFPGVGAAWPSMPREIATARAPAPLSAAVTPITQTLTPTPSVMQQPPPIGQQPAAPPPPPPNAPPTPQAHHGGAPNMTPGGGLRGPPAFNPFRWGYPDEGAG